MLIILVMDIICISFVVYRAQLISIIVSVYYNFYQYYNFTLNMTYVHEIRCKSIFDDALRPLTGMGAFYVLSSLLCC
jgi:hypothetical protein